MAIVVKHLPGKHDQQTHGNRYGPKKPPTREEVIDKLENYRVNANEWEFEEGRRFDREYWDHFNKEGPTLVYHGTRKRYYELIKEHGLKRGGDWMDRPPSVYFTMDEIEARSWSSETVIEFVIPDEWDDEIITDAVAMRDFDWESAFRIERDIPPENIKRIKVWERSLADKPTIINMEQKERLAYTIVICHFTDIEEKGGPGSGHHGHAGRPGKVGGSLPGKGKPSANAFSASAAPSVQAAENQKPYPPSNHTISSFMNEGVVMYEWAPVGGAENDKPPWADASDDNRAEWKSKIVNKISEDSGVDRDTVNNVVKQWAYTSNDEDLRSLSLQKAASEEFGVPMSLWQEARYKQAWQYWEEVQADIERETTIMYDRLIEQRDKFQERGWYVDEGALHPLLTTATDEEIWQTAWDSIWRDKFGPWGKYNESHSPITSRENERAILRAMYNYTQAELAAAGFHPDDTIMIWRGIGRRNAGRHNEVADYTGNAIESWSVSFHVGEEFRRGRGDVIGANVPIRNIMSTCKTGIGCLIEGEVVTFGTIPGMEVLVHDPFEDRIWRDVAEGLISEEIAKLDIETHNKYEGKFLSSKGGEGSGHHGHKGRPGKRGGSLPAGSLPQISSKKKNKKLSRELAESCNAQPKECYKNSIMSMIRVKGSKYIEGYFIIDFGDFKFPIEHGWLDKDGMIIDVTLPDDEGIYIPANSWTLAEALERTGDGATLPFSDYGDENWRKAAVQSWAELGLKIEKGGPGSGHHGHAGRPGKVGGSKPSGGKKRVVSAKPKYPKANPEGKDTYEQYRNEDGTWTKERAALHEKIINNYFEGKTPVDEPTSYVLGGGTAAGKSTLVRERYGHLPKNLVLSNSDDIKAMLPEYGDGEGAPFVHEESSYLAKKIAYKAANESYNVMMDGTGDGTIDFLKKKVGSMRPLGQPVIGIYVTVDIATAVKRNIARAKATGRIVPESYLRYSHRQVAKIYPEIISGDLYDNVNLYDTSASNGEPKLIATEVGKSFNILDEEAYARFLERGK